VEFCLEFDGGLTSGFESSGADVELSQGFDGRPTSGFESLRANVELSLGFGGGLTSGFGWFEFDACLVQIMRWIDRSESEPLTSCER
jgi:hypothetical protein